MPTGKSAHKEKCPQGKMPAGKNAHREKYPQRKMPTMKNAHMYNSFKIDTGNSAKKLGNITKNSFLNKNA